MAKHLNEHEAWKFLTKISTDCNHEHGLCSRILYMLYDALISSYMHDIMLKRIRDCKEANGKDIGSSYIFTKKTRPKFLKRMVLLTKPKKRKPKCVTSKTS